MKTHILLSRADIFNILSLIQVELLIVGSIWIEALATNEDLQLLNQLNYQYRVL